MLREVEDEKIAGNVCVMVDKEGIICCRDDQAKSSFLGRESCT